MTMLNIKPETYERLALKAQAQHTTVEALVEPVLDQLAKSESSPDECELIEQRRKAFDEWMRHIKQRTVRYPEGFVLDDSRESIYEGRGE
jgi:hypothetical protein